MSDFNTDQQKQTQEFFAAEDTRRQELFQESQEREQQFLREQADRQAEMIRESNKIHTEQDIQQLDRQAFKEAGGEWNRPDLQAATQQKFEVGDKVQAGFSSVQQQDDSLQFSKHGAAYESGQAVAQEVEIVASVELTPQQFANAFDDYSNEPQPFLQGHSGLTENGVQKAVAVSVPGQDTVVVVANQQGQAKSFGFEPRPALVQLGREQQPQVGQDRRAEAPQQSPEAPKREQAQQVKAEPLKAQSFTSNRWGADGISDRWSNHESAQRALQSDINRQKSEVRQAEESVRDLLKSREKLIEQSKGKSPEEIKKDPVLQVEQHKFEAQGKELEKAVKTMETKSAELNRSQNQYALNSAAFQADSWSRVRMSGEVMGSKETVQMASRKQGEFQAEANAIRTRQNVNPLSQEAQKMVEQAEQQKQQQKAQQQPAPEVAKGNDLSLSTTDYMRKQNEQAREQGAKVVVMPERNQHSLDKLAKFQTTAKEAAEAIAKAKAEKEQQDQQQTENRSKAVRP